MTKELPNSNFSKPGTSAPRLAALDIGAWDFLGHWNLEIGHSRPATELFLGGHLLCRALREARQALQEIEAPLSYRIVGRGLGLRCHGSEFRNVLSDDLKIVEL